MPLVSFPRVVVPDDLSRISGLLCGSTWPFHSVPQLTPERVEQMEFESPSTRSHLIVDDAGSDVGLVRLQDLDHVDVGSPMFDLRIAAAARGHGYGSAATAFVVSTLFDTYPQIERIEGNTREDNVAMQRAFVANGFLLEGRLRRSWPTNEGLRKDTLVYGILREERRS